MMEKSCQVFKTKKSYKIITQYIEESGIYIALPPFYIHSLDVEKKELYNSIFLSLNESKKIILKQSYSLISKENLKELKETSWTSLYKNSFSCSVDLDSENQTLKITRLRFSSSKGLAGDSQSVIILNYQKETEMTIIQKIIEVLDAP